VIDVGVGLVLTIGVTGAQMAVFGPQVVVASATFGLLAIVIQVFALVLLRPVLRAPLPKLMQRWGMGMGLRALGVVLFAVAVGVNRELFPPLPTAFGYLGVIVPLLFMETRYLR